MSDEYYWYCKKCEYGCGGLAGITYTYPLTYAIVMEDAKNGKWGKELQEILEVFPNAVFDAEYYIFHCEECGEYDNRPLLTAFVPKEIKEEKKKREKRKKQKQKKDRNQENKKKLPWEEPRRWSVSFPVKAFFMSPREMREYCDLLEEYDHRCKKCGGKMIPFPNDWRYLLHAEMICPHCKMPMDGPDVWQI